MEKSSVSYKSQHNQQTRGFLSDAQLSLSRCETSETLSTLQIKTLLFTTCETFYMPLQRHQTGLLSGRKALICSPLNIKEVIFCSFSKGFYQNRFTWFVKRSGFCSRVKRPTSISSLLGVAHVQYLGIEVCKAFGAPTGPDTLGRFRLGSVSPYMRRAHKLLC